MANNGFRYQPDIHSTLEPWREKLGSEFEQVTALLTDRDRAIEDYVNRIIYDRVNALVTFGGGETFMVGAWNNYSPSTSNITQGNGTLTGRYVRIGRTIVAQAQFVLGTTSAVTGRPGLGVPFSKVSANDYIGMGYGLDQGIQEYTFGCRWASDIILEFLYPDGAHVANGVVNATFPFTWGTSDGFRFVAIYEAAS
jgi:hypothetical protein